MKVIVPTFTSQTLIRPEMVYQHDREDGYFKVEKGKNKRKIISPKQTELKVEGTQAQEVTQAPENQEPKNVEATQTQDNLQVPPLE